MSAGICKCGCGEPTPIAIKTSARRGQRKGEPIPFLRGHHSTPSLAERFWAKVDRSDPAGCWIWVGTRLVGGYGKLQYRKRQLLAHRVAYELVRGPIPDGLVIDHLCRVRHCVNPDHLEVVESRENTRRGMSPSAVANRTDICAKGHVGQYHVYPSGHRRCLTCQAAWKAAYRETYNASRNARRAALRAERSAA